MNKEAIVAFNQFIRSDSMQKRFNEVFGKDAAANTASIITLYNSNDQLQKCDRNSIIAAAVQASLLHLPLSPQLGYAYIVPYGKQAQFQIGWKGWVQLAMRSGEYLTINNGTVYEGQIKEIDFVTGEIIRGEKISNKVIGYCAYYKLKNGFEKMLYMTVDEIQEFARNYSKSYQYDLNNNRKTSVWSMNFDAMAKKTVLKQLLTRYGIVSIDMERALAADQTGEVKETYTFIDNDPDTLYSTAVIDAASDADSEDDEFPFGSEVDSETGELIGN